MNYQKKIYDTVKSYIESMSALDEKEREINKQLAVGQIDIRRTLGRKQEELKDKLFVELRDMLANYLERGYSGDRAYPPQPFRGRGQMERAGRL